MAFEHIIKHYGVPACIGRRVVVDGQPGVIASDAGQYIGVLFDSDKPNRISNCHPTWNVVYEGIGKVRKMTASQKRYAEYVRAQEWYDGTFADWLGIRKNEI